MRTSLILGALAALTLAVPARAAAYLQVCDGHAVNRVLWDGQTLLPQPGGCTLVPDDGRPLWLAPQQPQVVLSVLPVAWRRAMRAMPAPDGSANMLAWLLAMPLSADQRDAVEYMVRAERTDLIAGGLPPTLVDAVMALAATYPGADPVYGAAP